MFVVCRLHQVLASQQEGSPRVQKAFKHAIHKHKILSLSHLALPRHSSSFRRLAFPSSSTNCSSLANSRNFAISSWMLRRNSMSDVPDFKMTSPSDVVLPQTRPSTHRTGQRSYSRTALAVGPRSGKYKNESATISPMQETVQANKWKKQMDKLQGLSQNVPVSNICVLKRLFLG